MAKYWSAKFRGAKVGDYFVVESLGDMYSWESAKGGVRCVGAEFATATDAARALVGLRGDGIPRQSVCALIERCRERDLLEQARRAA